MAIFNETMVGGISSKNCTATSANILEGKTAVVDNEIVTGTMANNGAVGSAISNGELKVGYTSGGTIANLSAENIKQGVSIGGIIGAFSGDVSYRTFVISENSGAKNPYSSSSEAIAASIKHIFPTGTKKVIAMLSSVYEDISYYAGIVFMIDVPTKTFQILNNPLQSNMFVEIGSDYVTQIVRQNGSRKEYGRCATFFIDIL